MSNDRVPKATDKDAQRVATMRDHEAANWRDWRSIDFDGVELDIQARAIEARNDMNRVWYAICEASAKDTKLPSRLADEIAGLFSDQLADYIEGFPGEQHRAVARHILYGLLWNELYEDTDAYDDPEDEDSE